MNEISGGVAAVSVGIGPLLIVVVLIGLAFGVWKLAKLLWVMFGS
jgi:hypothetical protein